MIETEQTVLIDVGIDGVWDYAKDMRRWAELDARHAGMRRSSTTNDSRWTLKVGVGGLVRTVKVLVHVDEWDGPERVDFLLQAGRRPGRRAAAPIRRRASGPARPRSCCRCASQGGGPMAPMWEAMGRPLLPQLAKGFADQLKAAIEREAAGAPRRRRWSRPPRCRPACGSGC